MTSPRVFIGLFEIAGYYSSLHLGLEARGCRTTMVSLASHRFSYAEKPCGWTGRLIQWHFRRALQVSGHVWPQWMPPWLRRFTGWLAVWLAALRHDVFFFSCGLSFADGIVCRDMEPLRRLKRKVIFIFNGSDSRAPYCDRTGYFLENRITSAAALKELTRQKAARLSRVHELADLVIDYPLSGHFHTRRFINFIRLGIPTVVPSEDELPPPPGSMYPARPIHILHCPSDTGIKGSTEIHRVIDHLKAQGWNIEFIELRGVPNATVMECIKNSDLVIDQLYSDTPMAGLAREAAQFARPVIIAGYAWEELRDHLPPEEWPPAITCHPDRLEECVRDFLQQGPAAWQEAGLRGYRFIKDRWSAAQCAGRLLDALARPDECGIWVDPQSCRYVWGCGMHALETIESAQVMMRTKGEAGFCLYAKPELLAKTAALGSMDLMEAQPAAIPELSSFDAQTLSVVTSLVERNASLQVENATMTARLASLEAQAAAGAKIESVEAELAEAKAKLENFRAMIKRRDERIEKLEKKLGGKKGS
ncbi:MAG: hypothetical protein K1X78_02215 [Verrucomicrobiaceae bacterium]|nr:hypothetical protein [Verrucomicrobiaceae bacterium]